MESQVSGNSMQMESILCPDMHADLTHDRTVIMQCALKVNDVVIENTNLRKGYLQTVA